MVLSSGRRAAPSRPTKRRYKCRSCSSFHRRIAQVPPQLQAVDAQHGLHCKRRAPTQRLMRTAGVRLDECDQGLPRHHLVHLFKKDFLARLLVEGVQPQRDLVHAPIFSSLHAICRAKGSGVLQTFLRARLRQERSEVVPVRHETSRPPAG